MSKWTYSGSQWLSKLYKDHENLLSMSQKKTCFKNLNSFHTGTYRLHCSSQMHNSCEPRQKIRLHTGHNPPRRQFFPGKPSGLLDWQIVHETPSFSSLSLSSRKQTGSYLWPWRQTELGSGLFCTPSISDGPEVPAATTTSLTATNVSSLSELLSRLTL